MPGRHRQPVLPRAVNRRALAAGASGLAAVFAVAPLAHADEAPVDTTSSSAPSSDAASAPASSAPASSAPASSAPASSAPASSDAPSSAPSSAPPSSPSSSTTPAPRSPSVSKRVAPKATLAADYGSRKLYLGVQLKSSAYAANGTAGSVITVHETGPGAPAQDFTCSTTANGATDGSSYCGDGPFGSYVVQAGDIATITQTGAPDGVLLDPVAQNVDLCTTPDGSGPFGSGSLGCVSTNTFTDAGAPPTVTDPTQPETAAKGETTSITPDQVDEHGAPVTSVDVSDPAHGDVAVVQDSTRARASTPVTGAFHLEYTPDSGYVGPDSFTYTLTTANGTSAAVTVSLRVVGDAPSAHPDSGIRTVEGRSVTIAVLANDEANGGGSLRLGSVGTAGHGVVRVEGNKVVYTPAKGFSGRDSFRYAATTYSGTDSATVSLTVRPLATGTDSVPPASPSSTADTGPTADTGANSAGLLGVAGGLLVAGAGATALGRRRRTGGHA